MTRVEIFGTPSGLPVDNPTASYWHKEPSEKLIGHRTTEDLPRSADVVVVGSGITGAFAAHFLKERKPDLNVVMLEAREACWGATGRNGGHCQPAIYAAAAPHIASFELRNYSYLKNLVEEFSIPCDWKSTTGVHAYYSAELFSIVKDIVAKLTDNYPDLAANVALITKGEGGSPSWLLEDERRELTLEGLRVPNAEGAVVQWHAASLWPYKLVAFVLERLLEAGGFNLQTNTPVTRLSKAQTEATPPNTGVPSSSPAWTVHTPRGDVTAPQVILATNGYTSHLLPQFSDLVVPVKGQVAALKPPQEPSSPTQPPLDIGHTFYIAGFPDDPYSRDDYLVQRPPPAAELVFGGGRLHAKGRGLGVWDDSVVDEPVAWYLRGELGRVVDLSLRTAPQAPEKGSPVDGARAANQDLTPTHEWTGIMGYSRDGHPWVGPVPRSVGGGAGLHVCAGFTGHGMPNTVLSAKAAVDLLLSGVPGGAEGAVAEGDDDVEVDLPPEYLLTEERILAARLMERVEEADERGSLWTEFGRLRTVL